MHYLKELLSTIVYISILFLTKFHATSFHLKGSEFAFVKLEEWKPCQNGSLDLEFKTTFENVLILYTDDGGIKDYFELKLLRGILHLVFELGSGKMRMVVGEQLNDNQWHKVMIIRKGTNISLHVDDLSNTRHYQGKDKWFGIKNKKNNNVFIGGISKDYEDRTGALTLQMIFFETRFNGYIRNILFSNCGGPLFRPKILDSINMTMFSNECITNNPCLHGGVCLQEDKGVSCDCSYTNFRGDNCEIEKTPTEVTLHGAQHLMYNLVRNNSNDVFQSTQDKIDLYFRTQQPDGLLFYIGDKTDHIIISLRNGGVFVRVNLGSGPWEGHLQNNGYKFDDNQWHHLVVTRNSREIHVTVDGSHRLDGTTLGPYSMLKTTKLFVGGSPHPLYKTRVDVNFKGCLKKVLYNSDKVSLDITTMALDGDLTVFGEVVFNQCQDMVETEPITFTTTESYIVLPRWEVGIRGGTISFSFQTNEQSGVILYNHGFSNSDFFAFEILDGYLDFLINLGSGTEKVKMKYVSDGGTHSVSLHHEKKTGYILLDGQRIDYTISGESNHLDLHSKLYVGGIDKRAEALSLPKEMWAGILGGGFVGCLHDLVMNSNKIDLLTAARKQMTTGIKNFCRVMKSQCNRGSCLHHGTCQEGWNRYLCDCRGTGYGGPICQTGATTLDFDGAQFVKVTMEDVSVTEAEDISLRFRTIRKNGLLFITSSDHSPDKMEMYLEAGSIKFDMKIGQSSKGLSIGKRLNDDNWHTVYIKRRGEVIQLKLDNDNPIEDHLQLDINLHIKYIVLGSVAPMLSDEYIENDEDFSRAEIRRMQQEDSILRRHTSYVGAMQQFMFNGNQYFDLAKSRKMENIEVTAIFDTDEPVLKYPVTFKSEDAYVVLPPLNANTQFSIYLKFKTTESDGLIIYNGGKLQDFLALELQGGNLLYLYDTGNGPRRILVNTSKKLNDNLWHDVSLIRTSEERQLIRVDDNPPTAEDMTDFSSKHFNLDGDLYIGGVRKMMYNILPSRISSRHGFQGCMASVDLNGIRPNLFEEAREKNSSIVQDCQGPSSGCKPSYCHNYGRCVQQWNSYICDCDMTSYTGPTCNEESISYTFGPRGGLITYERPKGKYFDTTQDQFALGFYTSQPNSFLFRVESNNSKDFIEMSLNMGHILITYNLGTKRAIPIGETLERFNDRKYHIVRFKRSGSNATITIDDDPPIVKIPQGHRQRWYTFNNQARIFIGGRGKKKGRIDHAFHGTIAGLVFNGLPLLEKAAEGDRRITIEGDVRLNRREVMQSTRETRQTTPMHGVADEIIITTEDPTDCIGDDEDDCITFSGAGSADEIIVPISTTITFSTPKPPETPEPRLTSQIITLSNSKQADKPLPSTLKNMNRICEESLEGCPGFVFSGQDTTQSAIIITTAKKGAEMPNTDEDGKKKLALIIGIAVGVLFTIIILIIALYKFRSRDEGTYKVDESKNFAYLESKNLQGNGAIIGASNIKTGKKKDVKEWYV